MNKSDNRKVNKLNYKRIRIILLACSCLTLIYLLNTNTVTSQGANDMFSNLMLDTKKPLPPSGAVTISTKADRETEDLNCAQEGIAHDDHDDHSNCGTEHDDHDDHSSCDTEHDDHSSCDTEHDDHSSCGSSDTDSGTDTEDHTGHNHEIPDGKTVFSLTNEERLKSNCEHNMKVAHCHDCSSSVGIVHVASNLIIATPPAKPLIEISKIKRIEVDDSVETVGHITLNEDKVAHISPRIEGTVTRVFSNLGDKIKKGDHLFEIVSTEIGKATATYKRAQSLVRLSKKELNRAENMKKLKVTSEKEVLRSSYELEQAVIELSSAKQQLFILGISNNDINSAKSLKELSQGITIIKSPVNGVITMKHAVTGEVVNPSTIVLEIAELADLWVWARVYDKDIGIVLRNRDGLKAKKTSIQIAAYPGKKFKGFVDYISPLIEKETGTLQIRITVPNKERVLMPGMFCRIILPLRQHSMLAIPRYAVLNDGETNFVFVPFGKNSFAAKEIKTGPVHGDYIPIKKGLAQDSKFVSKGTFLLKSEVLKDRMGAG